MRLANRLIRECTDGWRYIEFRHPNEKFRNPLPHLNKKRLDCLRRNLGNSVTHPDSCRIRRGYLESILKRRQILLVLNKTAAAWSDNSGCNNKAIEMRLRKFLEKARKVISHLWGSFSNYRLRWIRCKCPEIPWPDQPSREYEYCTRAKWRFWFGGLGVRLDQGESEGNQIEEDKNRCTINILGDF